MRYFGSKASTVRSLLALVRKHVGSGTFCDPFGGIATVSAHFKAAGFRVTTGDELTFANYFQIARIAYSRTPTFRRVRETLGLRSVRELPEYLNDLKPSNGWFVREYAIRRRFFLKSNACHIEAVRKEIRRWDRNELLTARERAFLIASLINSADRVANTAGTYYAFLKKWHRKATKAFSFKLIQPSSGCRGETFLGDASELVARRRYDVLYLDPPYNDRCYGRYYHLPETMATLDHWKRVHGKSGMPIRGRPSVFNSIQLATAALQQLLQIAKFRLLVFHYSDEGLISPREVWRILSAHGNLQSFELTSSGYTVKNMRRLVHHRVYLLTDNTR